MQHEPLQKLMYDELYLARAALEPKYMLNSSSRGCPRTYMYDELYPARAALEQKCMILFNFRSFVREN